MESKVKCSDEDFKRMYWHSRRGMLELDLVLVPFAERHLRTLDEDLIDLYRDMLTEEDQDLFVWLTQRADAPTPELRQIVSLILQKSAEDGPADL